MSNPVNILLTLAFVVFIAGVIDHPRVSAIRCVALGLALVTLARMIQ